MSTNYIPALGYRWLTGLYDPVVALTTRERTFKSALLAQARLAPNQQVLDLACGSGTLALMALAREPGLAITGVDGDPAMLAQARRKAEVVGASLSLDEGLADRLPYADASFDRVLSSLFFHHLDRGTKLAALREAHRVLKPGGELHIADWGRAANPLMRAAFVGIQLLDGFATTADSVAGLLPELMRTAGFANVQETRRFSTVFGTMSLYSARQ
ncbi:MAG: class I SAM-dependent methyltransferase [Sinimarinibacterium sp.]|jgi:ubiquinone/menaquinone biosynthesis C-methylase UbiE